MHLSKINILIHYVFYMFRTRGRIFTKKVISTVIKVKEVKAVCGSYSTAALRHIALLPEWLPSFISRGAAQTKRRERPLLAKEGTIPGIYLAIRNARKLLGSLTCRKSGTWDRFFYVRKIQQLRPGLNPQTWVPEASMLTTRPPKPSTYGYGTVRCTLSGQSVL